MLPDYNYENFGDQKHDLMEWRNIALLIGISNRTDLLISKNPDAALKRIEKQLQLSSALRCVITSYSIHYTKLYETAKKYYRTAEVYDISGNAPIDRNGKQLKLSFEAQKGIFPGKLSNVITSYSIHYTKLYELILLEMTASVSLSR